MHISRSFLCFCSDLLINLDSFLQAASHWSQRAPHVVELLFSRVCCSSLLVHSVNVFNLYVYVLKPTMV
ncbi:hypothetical protein BV22DRAFT_921334 [Leucogyrophana mollusca]|uniref:Uncharacterized protein n=1 Tax=Leucogyrophana mollusca TaxID=85980 RepID=A0ACB8AX68_9AGAM|nr:hypothetical protein BV22DRAFT_921334 [Leucogyrophana mollusca]